MNTRSPNLSGRRPQRGSVVLILLILLTIMTLLASANSRALIQFHREVNLLEKRQIERLDKAQVGAATNIVSMAQMDSK